MKKSLLFAVFLAIVLTVAIVSAFVIQNLNPLTITHGTTSAGSFVIDNTYGNAVTSVTCGASGTYGSWVAFTNCPTSIAASSPYTVNFNVAVPTGTTASLYTIPVTINGVVNSTPVTDTENLQVTVPSSPSLVITSSLPTMSGYAGDDATEEFTLKNNGNTVLNNVLFSYNANDLEDSDGDKITLTFDPSTFNLNVGEEKDIEVTADIDDDVDYGTYDTTITISSGSANVTMGFSIRVNKDFCSDGAQGSRIILKRIEEPDSGDEFRAGDEIPVEVDVKNDYSKEIDVVLEAQLFDITDDVYLEEAETELSIDEDETETLQVDLKVPADVDSGNEFIVLIKVYEDGNEDEQCKDDFVDVEITKEKHSILVEKSTVTPETVPCGGDFSVQIRFTNAGKNDEDDVLVRLYNLELGIDERKEFSLDEGDDYTVNFNMLKIPKDAKEKKYTLTLEWFFDYDDNNDEYDESKNKEVYVTVSGNCLETKSDVSMTVQQVSNALPGEEFSVKVTLTNTGTEEATYTLSASGYESWASLTSIEPTTLTLEAGETGYSYIKMLSEETGSHSFTVKVAFGEQTKTQTVSVNVIAKSEGANVLEQLWFSMRHNMEWFLVNLILVIAIIVLIVLLARKGRSRQGQVLVVGGKKKPSLAQGAGPTEISLEKPKTAKKTRKPRRKKRRRK